MRYVLVGLILVLLAGCGGAKRINITTEPIDKPILVLPRADVLRARPVKWVLITPDNFDAAVEKLRKTGHPLVFFSLTDEGYENLGLNVADVRAYMRQQQAIQNALHNYYVKTTEVIDSANAQLNAVNKEVEKVNSEVKTPWYKKLNPFSK